MRSISKDIGDDEHDEKALAAKWTTPMGRRDAENETDGEEPKAGRF